MTDKIDEKYKEAFDMLQTVRKGKVVTKFRVSRKQNETIPEKATFRHKPLKRNYDEQ